VLIQGRWKARSSRALKFKLDSAWACRRAQRQ